jgi:hypothetical protein
MTAKHAIMVKRAILMLPLVNVLNANFRCYNTHTFGIIEGPTELQREFKSRPAAIAFLSLLKEDT